MATPARRFAAEVARSRDVFSASIIASLCNWIRTWASRATDSVAAVFVTQSASSWLDNL